MLLERIIPERIFLENLNKLIFDNGITKLSAILNDFGRASATTYKYGYGCNYGYGYGYGYGYSYSNGGGMGYYSDDKIDEPNFIQKLIKLFSRVFEMTTTFALHNLLFDLHVSLFYDKLAFVKILQISWSQD
ncbi:MAG: hypothetical protein R2772_06305 [Chitinophagales bacterium]